VLTRKVLLVGGGVLVVSVIVIYAGLYFATQSLFDHIDVNNALNRAELVHSALFHEVDAIDSFCADWAEWDDTYNFVLNRNMDYVESNLVDETFPTLNVNYIVYLDRNGEVVLAKGYDLENETAMNPSQPLIERFRELSARNDLDVKKGFLRFDNSIYAFSARPILRSDETGPYAGTLIFARIVDDSFIQSPSKIAGLSFKILPVPKEKSVKFVNESALLVEFPLEDYSGRVVGTIEFYAEREALGILSSLYLPLAFAGTAVGILVVLGYLLFVKRAVVDRVERLAESLGRIMEKGAGRVEVEGCDEITLLEKRINELLDAISGKIEEVEELNQNLRLVNKLMRHDILNDLTSIQLAVEVLKEEGMNDGMVMNIERSVSRIADLIRRVRTLEEIMGREAELVEIDLKDIIEEIVEKYNVEVEVEGETMFMADKNVVSVFDNLISNSVRHGNADKVFIRGEKRNGKCYVTFSDNGSGIPEEISDRIFEEGFSTKGSGLGLYIVKKLMSRYGGEIRLLSASPATFQLVFKC